VALNCGSIGVMNKLKLWLVLCLADLLAGTAVLAMPVTQSAGQDLLREQERGLVQANHLASQPLRPDAGVVATMTAANSPALLDLAKQPGAEFEAVLSKGNLLQGSGSRVGHRAEQELFGLATKEGLISAEVKSVLKDLRGELHQLTGDHFRSAQAADEAEQAQLKRRLDEAKSARGEPSDSSGRPMSEEERRLGAGRVALLTDQLIDEIKPWAITAAALFVLFQVAKTMVRKQAAAKMLRDKIRSEIHGKTSAQKTNQAMPEQLLSAAGQTVRVRQRIRLTNSQAVASSRSRRRRPF
jgi:hypothetical protein